MKGLVVEGGIGVASLGEAKHLDGRIVTARLFTGEDILAKKNIAIRLEEVR
jgi:hypothetical protein